MLLTRDEYQRGFISFDADVPPGGEVSLWTRTADRAGQETEWAGPYTDPAGAKVLSPPRRHQQLQIGMERGPDPHRTPVLTKVRWERDGQTAIWPGRSGFFNEPPNELTIGRDYGSSFRLILKPTNAQWPESVALLANNFRIRFWKEPIIGFQVTGFSKFQSAEEPDKLEMRGQLAIATTEGDVLEVLATVPGEDETSMQSARNEVEALVGLLAFTLGEGVTGKPLVEEHAIAGWPGELGEIRVPVRQVEPAVFKLVADDTGGRLATSIETDSEAISNGSQVGLGLRWLYRGCTSELLLDAFLAFFFGLEAVAAGWFASLQPPPVRQVWSDLQAYFQTATPNPPKRLAKQVLGRLSDFPLEDKLQRYWRHHSLKDPRESFRKLVELRNKIAHGATSSVESRTVAVTRDALRAALSAELNTEPSTKGWESELFELRLKVAYGRKDRDSTGDARDVR